MGRVDEIRIEDDEFTETGDSLPFLSVIVPVYDDPSGIRDTIESLDRSTYRNYEIIAVYTPSTGRTEDVLRTMSERIPELTSLREDEYRTPGAARNIGLEYTSGDVVVFVDADMRVHDDTLGDIARVFRRENIDYLGFPVNIVCDESEQTAFGRYDENVRFPVKSLMEEAQFCPTCCLAISNEIVEAGIRFKPELISGEDVVFGRRVYDESYSIGFCADISIDHPARNSASAIFKKGKKTGAGMYQMYTTVPPAYFPGDGTSLLRRRRAYTPRSYSYLERKCDDWDEKSQLEKFETFLVAYLENLGRTWGYLRQAVANRFGGPAEEGDDPRAQRQTRSSDHRR